MRWIFLVSSVLSCAFFLIGCGKVRNGTAESETTERLRSWAEAMGVAVGVGEDVRVYNSLPEFRDAWKKKEASVVAQVTDEYKQDDVWGRPIQFIVLKYNDDFKHIRILSVGKDGVFQGGVGDNLYVDIIMQGKSKPVLKVKGQ